MTTTSDRFDATIENYLLYRPSYPEALLNDLKKENILTSGKIIADIGSGTGFLSKLFLSSGNRVFGIEPNVGMRNAATTYLKEFHTFKQIAATAENTTLPNQSVDIITAGTAFHWFDAQKARLEFKRILKNPGYVVIVWNVRAEGYSTLMQAYEDVIRHYGKDYKDSAEFDQTLMEDFFKPFAMHYKSYAYSQWFDWSGFKGRLLSTSYSLRRGDTKYDEMMTKLKKIYDLYQHDGQVEFLYQTKMYYGQLV